MYSIDELLTNDAAFEETLEKMNAIIDREKKPDDSMNGGLETAQELGERLDVVGTGEPEKYRFFCNSGNEDY